MVEEKTLQIGSYNVVRDITTDMWGTTYEAINEKTSEHVLVNVIAEDLVSNESFGVRFDLLKSLLPMISHRNLLEVKELGVSGGMYYMVKDLPGGEAHALKTLAEYEVKDHLNWVNALEMITQGVAEGLAGLEGVNTSYFAAGIIHDNLTPAKIYLSWEKSLVGSHTIPVPKIDGYAESFLFFGEEDATLQMHMYPYSDKDGGDMFEQQHRFPFHARRGMECDCTFMQYSFGVLLYEYIAKSKAKGIFPTLCEHDPALNPGWDELVMRCMAAPYGKGFSSMREVADFCKSFMTKPEGGGDYKKFLQDLEVPKGMALVALPGKAQLGAFDGSPVEQPAFKVTVKPFFIDTLPVTCELFEAFLSSYQRNSYSFDDEAPAIMVSWHDAQAFCRWRSEREDLPEGTYRLPTEYEWEAAARGCSGDQYPWGEGFDGKRVHCDMEEAYGTVTVKSLPSGRFGLYGMLGNVWEWTASRFSAHPFSEHEEKGYSAELYVVKGGCWCTEEEKCRASARAAFRPTDRKPNVGFRCARDVEE
jgi:formylglycine-generating enzyme required for sulfatase activity